MRTQLSGSAYPELRNPALDAVAAGDMPALTQPWREPHVSHLLTRRARVCGRACCANPLSSAEKGLGEGRLDAK